MNERFIKSRSGHDNRLEYYDDEITSRSGYQINLSDGKWLISKNMTINFDLVENLIDINLIPAMKLVMSFYVKNYSSSHVSNIYDRFRDYLKFSKSKAITVNGLINFRSSLDREHEWYLGTIKGFLKKWHELGYEGVSDDVVDLLNSWRLKGNVKGDVVKRLDPEQGPLTDIELQNIIEAAASLYEEDKITIDQFAMVRLLSASGRRPIQLSHMKLKDVMHGSNKNQGVAYVLNIPRAKQRGVGFRGSFKQLQVTENLWRILDLQRSNVISRFEDKFGKLNDKVLLELPLFPDYKAIQSYDCTGQAISDTSRL